MAAQARKKSAPPPTPPASKLRIAGAVLGAASIVLVLTFSLFWAHYSAWSGAPVLEEGESTTLIIPHNTAWPGVVKLMHQQGVITRPRYFDFWARQRELPPHVKAGTYALTGPLILEQLDTMLREGGSTDGVSLTIPEGFNIYRIADRVEALGLCSRAAFLDAARDKALLELHDIPGESFEGYLFPDTYQVEKGITPTQLIEKLHAQWHTNWEELKASHPEALEAMTQAHALSEHDLVILASLIERETAHDPERGLVARVFLNRLEKEMRLQTDPTCVYGEETYDKIPSPRYCKDPRNRYSTYVIDGLPPGPIANPGLPSLQAALLPTDSSEARRLLFFVARRDGSGGHHFTRTFKEHKEAIKKFLR